MIGTREEQSKVLDGLHDEVEVEIKSKDSLVYAEWCDFFSWGPGVLRGLSRDPFQVLVLNK